jgi:uncharacterized protein YdgA (DUF945 family)
VKIDSADGRNTLDVGTIKLSGEQRRLFEDNPSLYIGPVEMTVAKLDARAPDGKTLAAEGLRIAGDVAEHDAFLDISVSYGFQSLNVAGQNIGPSRLDLGLRHLDAKSLSDFHRAYMKLASDPDFPPKGGKIDPAVFKTLQQPLTVIFQKSPEFGIDQLELDLPAGKISGKLSARLPGDKVGNLEEATADPTVLKRTLAMVETDAELAVPEALLRSVLGEARAPMLDQLLEVGYLKRQGEHLATKLKYADGKIVVNGKPVDPRMFGRPPQAE